MELRGLRPLAVVLPLFTVLWAAPAGAADKQFESPHVHPIAVTPDGSRLLAVNTPDHRLEVFNLSSGSPVLEGEVMVGIEPVTVRARTNTEAWVVNHVSDSICIVDLNTLTVVRTLLTQDEPTDVAFAGSPLKAFVCASQRDMIQVFDMTDLTAAPVNIPLDASDPRALAVSMDGTKVYVGIFESGNETTVVPEATVDTTLGLPPPVPPMDSTLATPPKVSLIVRHNGTHWVDELIRSWDTWITYRLYDNDVIEIDVASLTVTQSFKKVGTHIFGLAVNPVTGRLYVSNTESLNEIRFEPNLDGHFTRARVTTIDPGTATVTPVHLNQHINYGNPAGDATERSLSLGLPMDVTVNVTGDTVYVAAMGSNKVGVLDANGNLIKRINVGPGPTGLALDPLRSRLYVLNRHFGDISVVNLATDAVSTVELGFDPTPITTQVGRTLFYSTTNSSAHGDIACASCHIFTNMDGLAWDLGNPRGQMIPPPQPQSGTMHPMKGPLVTQALKGLPGTFPLHWRGDRANLQTFNPAFVSLQGRPDTLSTFDFSLFQEFLFSVNYPPNPNRNLDGSLQNPGSGPNPTTGETLFFTGGLVGGSNCDFCHHMPTGTSGLIFPKGAIVENQPFETPQFRNLYEKDGFTPSQPWTKNGFGFTHEGNEASIFTFTFRPIFTFHNDQERYDVESFLHRFDTGTHAAVGQQLTMDGTNEATYSARLSTLIAVADAGDCDVVAKGEKNGLHRGWKYESGTIDWASDRSWEPHATTAELLALAGPGTEITFTAVVPGCGDRLGLDRDNDFWYDRDEIDAGTNPADPLSVPTVLAVPPDDPVAVTPALEQAFPNPAGGSGTQFAWSIPAQGAVSLRVYDVQGRLVRTLVDQGVMGAGRHEESWDLRDDHGRRVEGGIYFLKLVTSGKNLGQRVVVLQ